MDVTNAYLRLFRYESEDLTPRQIRRMIERELKKPAPDADLIEYGLDALAARGKPAAARPVPLPRAARFALAAALIALLLFGAAAAAVTVFDFDPLQKIVAFYDDRIRVFTGPAASTVPEAPIPDAALAASLAAHGFADVHLPAAFFADPYVLSAPVYQQTELLSAARVGVTGGSVTCSVVITQYAETVALPAVEYPAAANAVHVSANGIDVFVFESGEGSVLTYVVGRTVHTVVLNCAVAAAAEIARTVR